MLFDSGEPTRHFYHEEIIELLLRSEIVQGLDCIHLNMICCIWLHIPLRLYLDRKTTISPSFFSSLYIAYLKMWPDCFQIT